MRLSVLIAVVTMIGCISAQKHSMARTVRIADLRFADEYADASSECIAETSNWTEYDACMAAWYAAYEAMRILITTTLALDVAQGRKAFRTAGCRWYRALEVVDATSPVTLPSIQTGLSSRWHKRCN